MGTTLSSTSRSDSATRFIWLEITRNCQLECAHCYASSGPGKGHGAVSVSKWLATLTEASDGGVERVQFIGGEPTAHPELPRLIEHALELGLNVEVYSNLFSIRDRVWSALAQPGVSLATSYYCAAASNHDSITGRDGSQERTLANVILAVNRGIPIRVGLVRMGEEQDIAGAVEQLVAAGVSREAIAIDDLRGIGRARDSESCSTEDELCGNCANGVIAVLPDGAVQPCVFSRSSRFEVGNLAVDSLTSVLHGERLQRVRDNLAEVFARRGVVGADCPPAVPGDHQSCGPACSPSCIPVGNCNPVVNPGPCHPQAGHPPAPEPIPRPPGPVCGPYGS